MEFHLIPNYKKPTKISKFSQGFQHTLQTLPTWRKSELPSGNQNNIRNFNKLYEFWGDPPIKEIDHDFLHATLQEMHEATGNSNSTLNRSVSTVKKVLTMCARSGYIPYVPVIQKLKEEQRRRPPHYSKDQVDRLVQIARERGDDAMAMAIEISAYTGLRQAEMRRLHVDDVDWRRNLLLIGGTVETRTKGRNFRELPIHPRLVPLLKARTGLDRGYHDYVFEDFPNQWNLHRRWKHVLRNACREDRTITEGQYFWKTLRNSFITWTLDDGMPSMKVMGWAGHSSIRVTERYYSQNSEHDHELLARL